MYSLKDIKKDWVYLREKLGLRGIKDSTMRCLDSLADQMLIAERKIVELNTLRNKFIKSGAIEHKEEIVKIKKELEKWSEEQNRLDKDLKKIVHNLPNIPDDCLTDEIQIIKTSGDPVMKFENMIGHEELATKHNLFDLRAGALITGSGYVVYCGLGAQLFRALIQFTLDENKKAGYSERYLPIIVSDETLFGTAQLPKFIEDLFSINSTKFLSPTSETQLVNLYRNSIIDAKDLPVKITANTNCFRKEAGAAGTDTTGIIRLHQFNKTEIVVVCRPDQSFVFLEEMMKHASEILDKLGLPYRVIQLPYHDMSFSSTKTYDIEVWFPSENRYREISSVSNTLDFQAKRAKIRYKDDLLKKEEKAKYPHILNGSSLAIDRLFAAILDNYQNKDGTISIPEKLWSYLDFKKIG